MKKILAVLLAALFVVSMSTMAFAADITGTVTTNPSNTTYTEGDKVDLAGLVITYKVGEDTKTAAYGTATGEFTANPTNVAKNTTKVTVTYDDGTDKVTASFDVTVKEKKTPTFTIADDTNFKKSYKFGDPLDITGLKVTYVDEKGVVDTFVCTEGSGVGATGYDAKKAGSQDVTITYKGLSATVKVYVNAEETTAEPTTNRLEKQTLVKDLISGLKGCDPENPAEYVEAFLSITSTYFTAEDLEDIEKYIATAGKAQDLVQDSSVYPDNWAEFVKIYTDYIPTAVNQQLDIAARLGWDASDQDFVQDIIDLVKGAAESDKAADKAADTASTDANPKTGSTSAIAVFAVLSVAAAAVVCTKKKED